MPFSKMRRWWWGGDKPGAGPGEFRHAHVQKGGGGLRGGNGMEERGQGEGSGRDQACTLTAKKNKADTRTWRRGEGVEQPKAERFEVSGLRSVRDEVKRKSR